MLKKYAIGAILGGALALSGTALAENAVRLIGKQVDNEYPVFMDGKPLSNKAPSIEGSSYAPVREIAERLGLEVRFEADTVYISVPSKQEVVKSDKQAGGQAVEQSVEKPEATKIDPSISTVTIEGVVFFSIDDFAVKYGGAGGGGKGSIKVSEGDIFTIDMNGLPRWYKVNDNTTTKVIGGKLYLIERAYPR